MELGREPTESACGDTRTNISDRDVCPSGSLQHIVCLCLLGVMRRLVLYGSVLYLRLNEHANKYGTCRWIGPRLDEDAMSFQRAGECE